MTQRILIVLHQEHSTPGRVGRLLTERGYELIFAALLAVVACPRSMDDYAGAVVFGGPMSANDPGEWCLRQTEWIGEVLRTGIPYLGLCLGAQMLARHLGASVTPIPTDTPRSAILDPAHRGGRSFAREIGADWPRNVYHWHREGFDVPPGAQALAEGDTFPNQAFRIGNAYGLQFHPEVTYAMMCRWTVRGHERLTLPGARQREEHLQGWYLNDPAVRTWLDAFLDHWLALPRHPVVLRRDGTDELSAPVRVGAGRTPLPAVAAKAS